MTPADEIQLPDRFRIEQEIGRGGMAVVYRAHDRHLDRFVAIKVLSSNLSHAMGVERFQRELALMAKLVHPGIVALFDSGEVNGRLYYVMPFVAGENLRARLLRERRMTLEDATAFGADVAEALAYAHGAGIVHRDVKPENIFTVGGRAVLADFGIAHIAGEQTGGAHLTSAGMVLGTMAYMSPEQANGESLLDGRSDLYSLGCVLYELLTGTPPFTAGTPLGVLTKHISEPPRPPSEHNGGLSHAVDDLILSLLAKDPDQRPATAGDVARALRAAGQTAPAPASPGEPSDADRLVSEGLDAIYRSSAAGPASRSHLDQAGVYINRALTLDPGNARGLCALANWYYTMGRHGFLPPAEAFAKGRELLLDALAADDRVAEVHNSLGKIALYYDDDCHAAARHIERAVALAPGDAEGLRFQSVVYKILGRTDAAIQSARAACARAPEMPSVWNGLGDVLLAAGRNAEAIDALKRAIALQPGYGPALERLELAHVRLGELDLALEIRASRLRLAGQSDRAEQLLNEAKLSRPVEAIRRDLGRELEELLRKAEQTDPFGEYYLSRTLADQIVVTYAALGEWHKAMDWVERAYARRPVRLRRMLTEPPFDRRGLAVDPRYARLLRVAVMEDLL
ncbi:MAG TPA: protein kinase [Gemmatimonadales bacterium]|nr:protein kinase [Gemmatimonadales bacterium]